jgi:3-hydroxyisobutyrate dehydrogenase-like beta-hydroxyacid dehydrogenase
MEASMMAAGNHIKVGPKVGILSPGDMGHSVGEVLRANGLQVYTCLKDRSERTRSLAQKAGLIDLIDYRELVSKVDLLLSILVPANALPSARLVAEALQGARTDLVYVDCNAVAPDTAQQISQVIQRARGSFVDASIIGPPPRHPGKTRFYASGEQAARFAALSDFGLNIIVLGEEVGQASALKMCYASSTKGFTALLAEMMVGAEAMGITAALMREFEISQPALLDRIQRSLPSVPAKAHRFVGEMEEIASTYQAVGLTPSIFDGAAEMYRLIGSTSLADRPPEDQNIPGLAAVLTTLVGALKNQNLQDDDANG